MLPLQATADEIKIIKRVVHERFAELKRKRGLRGVATFVLTLPSDLVGRMESYRVREGPRLADVIQAVLEKRFPSETSLSEERGSGSTERLYYAAAAAAPAPTSSSNGR